jgi:SpoVK/Ycf46/Vps4 family AAA+-type ATPase
MEYFRGLLFLTTNRVGQIDDAFISRVHVAFGYESLSPDSRVKIWQGFLKKLGKERAGQIQIAPQAKKWILEQAKSGKAQLNGRDIRNALQTAITLAEAEYNEDEEFDPEKTTVTVDQSHFARVLEITNNFQSYVKSIRREDERKRAAQRMDRNDYFNEESRQGKLPSEPRDSD